MTDAVLLFPTEDKLAFRVGEIGLVDAYTVEGVFTKPVKSSGPKNGVTIKVNGSSKTIDSAAIQANKKRVRFVLHAAVVYGDAVTLEYSAASGDISDLGGRLLANVSAKTIINNVAGSSYTPALKFNDLRNSMYL